MENPRGELGAALRKPGKEAEAGEVYGRSVHLVGALLPRPVHEHPAPRLGPDEVHERQSDRGPILLAHEGRGRDGL